MTGRACLQRGNFMPKQSLSLVEHLLAEKPLFLLRKDRDQAATPWRLNREKLIAQTEDALAIYTNVMAEEMDKQARGRRHYVAQVRQFMALCIAVGRREHDFAGRAPKYPHWLWCDDEWQKRLDEALQTFREAKQIQTEESTALASH
jgi:hypothetical protein